MAPKIRVLLADDHETVRQALRLLIDAQADMEVVAEAGDGRSAVRCAREIGPAVAVLDIAMPELNGLGATREIRAGCPATAVVALTRYADAAYVKELLAAGACGYVLKQSASSELVDAIRAAAQGRPYLDSSLKRETGSRPAGRAREPVRPTITDRETDVLRWMALGYSNKEIASTLDISVKTVEVHKANATRKLGLQGRIDVVKYAVLQGWLKEP